MARRKAKADVRASVKPGMKKPGTHKQAAQAA